MVIAIFRSRVAKEHVEEFERRYAEMSALVEAIPSSNNLDFYIGALLKKANGRAQLCLTKDLWHITPNSVVLDFPAQGRCVDLEFRASNYNLDDLTSNYR